MAMKLAERASSISCSDATAPDQFLYLAIARPRADEMPLALVCSLEGGTH